MPLLVRGSLDTALPTAVVMSFLVLFAIGVCGLLPLRGVTPIFLAMLLVVVLAGPTGLILSWLSRRRQWLEVTLTGFVLSRREQRRVYSDDQVVGLAQSSAAAFGEAGTWRRVVLEIGTDEGPERLDCRYTVPAGRPDPLAGFLDRLVGGLARRALQGLERGTPLAGQGWSLDRQGLRHGPAVYPIDTISWCGYFDGALCLWHGGEERPFLRLGLGSRNVHVLGQVLWHFISERPGHDLPLPGRPLGRLLLERSNKAWPVGLAVLLAALAGGGFLLARGLGDEPRNGVPPLVGLSVACVCIAAAGVLLCRSGWRGTLRFHEFGVVQLGPGGARQLLHSQVGEVVWKWGQVLTVRPAAGADAPTLSFQSVWVKFDVEVAAMRDHLCRFLARRWAEQVPHGPVIWTPRLRFLPTALEFRPAGLLGSGEPVCVPYPAVDYRLERNEFLLCAADEGQVLFKEQLDRPNFFVGLLVLNEIRQRLQQEALPAIDATRPAPRAALPGSATGPDPRIVSRPGGVTPRRPADEP